MATVTDAIDLLSVSKLSNITAAEQALVEAFMLESTVARDMPFVSTNGALKYAYTREVSLPSVSYRQLNTDLTATQGTVEQVNESLGVLTQRFKIDSAYGEATRSQVTASQLSMHLKALAATFQTKFFKGDGMTQGEINGLQNRATGNQLIAAGATSGGDALSLAKLDELVRKTVGPSKIIYCGLAMGDLLDQASRSTSFNAFVREIPGDLAGINFGGLVLSFKGVPIIRVAGLDGADDVLDFSEANPGGGSAVGTSLYCVSRGENGVHGLQAKPMEATPLGINHAQPNFQHHIEWVNGLAVKRTRAMTRLWGVKSAAVVA
jgi:hypothetical protein